MNISEIAKRIREAVMNRAENDGRVFHADAIEDEVTRILRAEYPPTNVWGYGTNLATGPDQPNTGESLFDVVNRMRVEWGDSPMTSQDLPDTNVTVVDIERLRDAARQIAANSPDDIGTYRMPIRDAPRHDTSRDYTSWPGNAFDGLYVTLPRPALSSATFVPKIEDDPEPTEWR